MTGNEMLKRALTLLGYCDAEGNVAGEQRMKLRALSVINTVYSDLFYALYDKGFEPLISLTQTIELPERILADVMPYGVASFLALGESDGDNQQLYTVLYNRKRGAINRQTLVQDVLPTV